MHAVFLGRFQPFHNGHLDALQNIQKEYDRISIVIGSSNISHTSENPWTSEERKIMIQNVTAQYTNISIVELPDIPKSDEAWLDSLIATVGSFDCLFSGNESVLDICEQSHMPCQNINISLPISATMIREYIKNNKDIQDLVPQAIYEYITTHPSYET